MDRNTQHTPTFLQRYGDLVSSNIQPSDAVHEDIQRYHTEVQTRISALDAELVTLNERLALAQSEKVALLKDEKSCRLVNAPIRRVPMDVLVEIFELTSPDKGRPNPQRAPLLLCQVCRKWRDTVIHTPRLWKTLWIRVPPRQNLFEATIRYKNAQTLAELWLSRAKGTPLNLKIELRFLREWGSFPLAQAFLKNILEICEQSIRTLEVYTTYLDELLHDLIPNQLNFPQLSEVRLSSDEVTDRWPMLHVSSRGLPGAFGITTFQGAKNLRTMICNTEGVRPILVPSYSSLTCLLVERALDVTEWFECFRHLYQLEIALFHLENPIDTQTLSRQSEVVSFRNLKRLYIYHVNEFHCMPFQSLEFPALEDFRLYFEELISSPEVLYRTMPNVRHLAIRCSDDGLDVLDHISALKDNLQNVEEFECSVTYQDMGHIFTQMSATSNSPLFPRMKKIALRIISEWEEWEGPGGIFSRDDIKQAILSRWNPTENRALLAPLNYIRFIIKDQESSDVANEEFDDLLETLNLEPEDNSLSEHFNWEVSENGHLGNSKALIQEDALDLENTCRIRFRYESIQEYELVNL